MDGFITKNPINYAIILHHFEIDQSIQQCCIVPLFAPWEQIYSFVVKNGETTASPATVHHTTRIYKLSRIKTSYRLRQAMNVPLVISKQLTYYFDLYVS